ncbi:hypothetical protein [Desertivirga brevis]|uniref:hypothetical protein n=1 Tax=Desertivirga brevis TaxID=2810310 RepID=UPI001A960A38|nr:hypothetical protein [Pedobacter sp. SYSU D00873]
MTHLFKIILLCVLFLTLQKAVGQVYNQKVFEFKSVTDTGYVKAELYFLQDKNFCIIRFTKKANKVTGGTYVLAKDSLYLTFKPKIVTHGVRGRFRFYLRERKTKLTSLSFRVIPINPEQIYANLYKGTFPVAIRTTDGYDEQDKLKSLFDSPEWVVLQGKRVKDLKREWRDENNEKK